ncbi:hypothetical protein [Hamadaea tsunoensis]|uniref:hypothetical protein n=1 Tax=Hamadaea tsunoensis TaxID=53368 RepID=UPI00042A0BC7|nr:hypothetical protein [Hamadaea tsunoensis]
MKESSTKWAIGTGIAALALILGVFQWLYPHGPADGTPSAGSSAGSASASHKPQTDLEKTPMIGYEFWQNGARAMMRIGPESPAYVTYVNLARAPFEIHLPKPPGDEAVRIAAWSDKSIFDVPQNTAYADDRLFGMGRGMANGGFFDGNLFLSDEGMNYLVGNRLTELSSTMDKILVSAFGDTRVQERADPVYLTIFIDDDHDGIFDITEYEYVVLTFDA